MDSNTDSQDINDGQDEPKKGHLDFWGIFRRVLEGVSGCGYVAFFSDQKNERLLPDIEQSPEVVAVVDVGLPVFVHIFDANECMKWLRRELDEDIERTRVKAKKATGHDITEEEIAQALTETAYENHPMFQALLKHKQAEWLKSAQGMKSLFADLDKKGGN